MLKDFQNFVDYEHLLQIQPKNLNSRWHAVLCFMKKMERSTPSIFKSLRTKSKNLLMLEILLQKLIKKITKE
jgi:hypothetical protein